MWQMNDVVYIVVDKNPYAATVYKIEVESSGDVWYGLKCRDNKEQINLIMQVKG